MRGISDQRGQAAVEIVALLPFVVLMGALLLQAAIAGQWFWLALSAAGAGSRAHAVGLSSDRAARRALPDRLEAGLRVRSVSDGGVRLTVRVPSLWGGNLGSIDASARMEPQK